MVYVRPTLAFFGAQHTHLDAHAQPFHFLFIELSLVRHEVRVPRESCLLTICLESLSVYPSPYGTHNAIPKVIPATLEC